MNQPPVAQASANPASGTAPLAVQFSAAGSTDPDGTIVSYLWSFGDGTSGTGPMPLHIYRSPWAYRVSLTVIDDRDIRIIAHTTGELLRHLQLDPTRDYQPQNAKD